MPRNILIVDDTPFWRDVTGDVLRKHGYTTFTAADAQEALNCLRGQPVDLIILDVEMPGMKGLDFLEQLREDGTWKNLPVIMLTGDMRRDHIIRAVQLGAAEYLLKARFSMNKLLTRVQTRLQGPATTQRTPAPKVASPQIAIPAVHATESDIPHLLTRQQAAERVGKAMSGRNLSLTAADVISMANSPEADLTELATLIGRDPVLSARVIHASNRAANAGGRGKVADISEAVRVIGCAKVRDIAVSVGVFDALPTTGDVRFDPIRSWQHSLAVATLCGKLAPPEIAGTAHLVGLCHDLGEYLFRSQFGAEYDQVLCLHASSGKSIYELERHMLGITHAELSKTVVQCLQLPKAISGPIAEFHQSASSGSLLQEQLARILHLADLYANGLLLASSPHARIRPLFQTECRKAVGDSNPSRPDGVHLREEIFSMTNLYATNRKRQAELAEPILEAEPVRVVVVREQSLSAFDPIHAAAESLTEATATEALPSPLELQECEGLIVLTRNDATPGLTPSDIHAAATRKDNSRLPVLWLAAKSSDPDPANPDKLRPTAWPISLDHLAHFIQGLTSSATPIRQIA